ncbi:MAG: hypothetical protein F9K38_05480 [Pseudorhodoplanes sp.]|nr:MAG: hypothetical protein F9K38_05480 [Pseudorhodoplanes sp.]
MIAKGGRGEFSGAFLGCRLPVDSELLEAGWEWRCNVDHSKLAQLIDFYEELGFEVCLKPVRLDCLSAECKGCAGGLSDCKAVFVRQKNRPGHEGLSL